MKARRESAPAGISQNRNRSWRFKENAVPYYHSGDWVKTCSALVEKKDVGVNMVSYLMQVQPAKTQPSPAKLIGSVE